MEIFSLLGCANLSWDTWVNMSVDQTGGHKALQNVPLQSPELAKLVGQISL